MYEYKIRVRKDGAINIGKQNRTRLGITPYMEVKVGIDNGVATLTPTGYRCACCNSYTKTPVDNFGICPKCNSNIVKLIKDNKAYSFAEAFATTQRLYRSKVVQK